MLEDGGLMWCVCICDGGVFEVWLVVVVDSCFFMLCCLVGIGVCYCDFGCSVLLVLLVYECEYEGFV